MTLKNLFRALFPKAWGEPGTYASDPASKKGRGELSLEHMNHLYDHERRAS